MGLHARHGWAWGLILAAGCLVLGRGVAAEPASPAAADKPAAKVAATTIDMFDGMKSGALDVKIIPHDAKEAHILIKNNTDQPLDVRLPDAFAAMPALAQQINPQQRNNNNNNNNPFGNRNNNNSPNDPNNPNSTKNQAIGGPGHTQGTGNQLGAHLNVAPEKVANVAVPVVCLEFGKDEPNAKIPYEIRPIESYGNSPELAELCKLMAKKDVDQKAAQAAAWHLANHKSWKELKDLKKLAHNSGFSQHLFTSAEIAAAMKLTDEAMKIVEARKGSAAPVTSSTAASLK